MICFGRIEQIEGFRQRLGLSFPVATDPERKAYQAYGIERAPFWRIWAPRVLWKYLTLKLQGISSQRTQEKEDVYQLGGDFLIDGEGVLLFAHVSTSPVDRPKPEEFLNALSKRP